MPNRNSILAAISAVAGVVVAAASCSSSSTSAPLAAPEGLTFATDIEPLVREKCQPCHREGGIAPFSLVTYEQVKQTGALAKEKVTRREMPPWGATSDATCSVTRAFKDDLSLTPTQIDTFASWVDAGMPRGDLSKVRPVTRTVEPAALKDKTSTHDLAASYTVEAMGTDELRCFPVDPGFEEDTWVAESLVVPADPRVVHHALVYVDEDREGVAKAGGSDSYPCFGDPGLKKRSLLLAWSPAGSSTTYGEDAAVRIPKGAHLVMQAHYHPIATATTGRMRLELKSLPQKPAHVASFVLLGDAVIGKDDLVKLLPGPDDPPGQPPVFLIPPNAKDHVEALELVMPRSVQKTRIAAVGPHMHWAGVKLRLEIERASATAAEPGAECLLGVPKYDFTWQRTYVYGEPFHRLPVLRGGDKLRVTCTYDNTGENPHIARLMQEQRRTQPAPIRLGGTSNDEMCQAILVLVE
jgi:hypothetical protein